MPVLDTPAGRVAYDEQGGGDADDTLVLLASGAHDRHDFDELRALLPERWRTIALDWPGHGQSPPGDGPASAMRLADIAEHVVERLAPNRAIVLGNSVGWFSAAHGDPPPGAGPIPATSRRPWPQPETVLAAGACRSRYESLNREDDCEHTGDKGSDASGELHSSQERYA
jgi:hypothetical protein